MATEIRPELSEKNPYWIGKHRYYELKHFCLQYPIWKKAYNALLGLSSRPNDLDIFVKSGQVHSDPTARCAESRVSLPNGWNWSSKLPLVRTATSILIFCEGSQRVYPTMP